MTDFCKICFLIPCIIQIFRIFIPLPILLFHFWRVDNGMKNIKKK